MPTNAGDLDRQITLQRYSLSRDQWNQPISAWADFATAWASWRRASSNERLAASQVTAVVTDVFEIYWSPEVADLNPKDRLSYDGQTYDIAEVTEIGRREGLLIRGSRSADGAEL